MDCLDVSKAVAAERYKGPGAVWDAAESANKLHTPAGLVPNLNAYINGHIAYVRFARLVGDGEAADSGMFLLARALAVSWTCCSRTPRRWWV